MPQQKKSTVVEVIQTAREQRELTVVQLAKRAKMTATQLSRVLNKKSLLTREQAFHVGIALEFSEIEMERLALMVVLSNAKTKAFQDHIKLKLSRIEAIHGEFLWTDYIRSTFSKTQPKP